MKELLEDYIKKTKPEYYPPVENLLLQCVAVQKQTVNLGIGSGSRMYQTVYEKIVCGNIQKVCNAQSVPYQRMVNVAIFCAYITGLSTCYLAQ